MCCYVTLCCVGVSLSVLCGCVTFCVVWVCHFPCCVGVSLSVLCGCVTLCVVWVCHFLCCVGVSLSLCVCCVGMVAGGHNGRQCSHLEALES